MIYIKILKGFAYIILRKDMVRRFLIIKIQRLRGSIPRNYHSLCSGYPLYGILIYAGI